MKFIKALISYYKSDEYKKSRRIALKLHYQIQHASGIHFMSFL